MAAQFLIFLTLFSLFSFASPLSTDAILGAATVLSHSGYNSMALTLEFGSRTIIPTSQSLTIFTAIDAAFSQSGQPSLSLLQFHFSPLFLSMHSLKSLPPATKIPTLLANHSIIVTSSAFDGSKISLNGVRINGSVVYDDGSLVIFGIDRFLDPNFEVSGSINGRPIHSYGCPASAGKDSHSFEEAISVLRARGYYSVTASFLDLQVAELKEETRLTIFAPLNDVIVYYLGNLSEYRSIFLRHFLPCKIEWRDMVTFDDGLELPTYVEGFMLNMEKSGDTLLPNGVSVTNPDMYTNDWLVVHGLGGSFVVPQSSSSEGSSYYSYEAVAGIMLIIAFCLQNLLLIL